MEFMWLRGEFSDGLCEDGSEPSGSIKCGKFVDKVRDWQLFHKTLLDGFS
jgi:hypothetical protein